MRPYGDDGREWSETLGDTQLGAARARVARLLVFAGHDGVACEDAQAGRAAADARWKLRRADAAALFGLEEALDDAILQGMEADDGEPAAGSEQVQRGGKRGLQTAQLVVDGDAQSLEGARGGVDAAGATVNNAGNQSRQLAGARDGRAGAPLDDAPGDGARAPLLTVAVEHIRQRGFIQHVDQIGGGWATCGIEAHVQRGVGGEAEAALAVGELVGGEAEVEQD